VSPRVGVTYALDDSRKTIARASYSMFAGQLGAGGTDAGWTSAAAYSYAYFLGPDLNGNNVLDANEAAAGSFLGGVGFDAANPNAVISYNTVASNFSPPRTNEVVIGLDRELMPNLGFSASFTWRRYTDVVWKPLIGVTQSDYLVDGAVSGNLTPVGAYSQDYFALNPAVVPPGSGREYGNRPDYHQTYKGLEVAVTKRMSNHWMGRFGFSTNSDREYFDGPASIQDPTPQVPDDSSPLNVMNSALVNGGLVATASSGSGKSGIYLVPPRYQFTADGLYEAPYGIAFGANLVERQGFAEPFYQEIDTNDPVNTTKDVLVVNKVDQFRLPSVALLNARVEWNATRAFKLNRPNLYIDFDVFNLFNNATVLGREYDFNSGDANAIREIMNPRIARIGVRFDF